ncbi:hypothetical protein WCN65_15260, partial [Staphylococcus aureus]
HAVTQRLKAIENAFGVDIFIRTKNNLITTTEGTMIIEHARDHAVTQRLKAIENAFGVDIFIRTKNNLITTTEG